MENCITNPLIHLEILLNAELAKHSVMLPCSLQVSKLLRFIHTVFDGDIG